MISNGCKTRRTANTIFLTLLFSVCLGLLVASCGQRGPLYLPKPDSSAAANARSEAESGEPAAEAANDDETAEDEETHEETP